MTDLDFDELDKAVTNLLGDKSDKPKKEKAEDSAPVTTDEPVADEPAKTTSISVTQDKDEESKDKPEKPAEPKEDKKVDQPEPPKEPKTEEKPKEEKAKLITQRPMMPSGPSRRNAKFIDVVHPAPSTKPKPDAHTAPVIKPISKDLASDDTHAEDVTEKETPATAVTKPETAESTAAKDEPEVVDHVDIHGFKDELAEDETPSEKTEAQEVDKPEEKLESDKTADEAEIEPTAVAETSEKEAEASTSPFLPEAKVEKRPLGAFSDFTPEAVPEEPVKTPEELKPSEPGEKIPAELENQLVEVEGGEPLDNLDGAAVLKPEPNEETPKKADEKPAEQAKTQNTLTGVAMASIPQQYQTEDKPLDEDSHPIFDTIDYHPPLHPGVAHKQSRLVAIVNVTLVILLIIALVVGGYFAYQYFVVV